MQFIYIYIRKTNKQIISKLWKFTHAFSIISNIPDITIYISENLVEPKDMILPKRGKHDFAELYLVYPLRQTLYYHCFCFCQV